MSDDTLREASVPSQSPPFKSEFQPLIDELYREEVLEARRMSSEEKFLAGEELFKYACSITLAGIHRQNPAFSEEECHRGLERRLELQARLERIA